MVNSKCERHYDTVPGRARTDAVPEHAKRLCRGPVREELAAADLSYNRRQELTMSDTVMLSVRIPAELAKRLDSVAGATERTRTYVAARAIAEYVESEEETLAKIREGL